MYSEKNRDEKRRVKDSCDGERNEKIKMAHHQLVLSEEVKSRYQLCERSILSAATLPEFDDAYTR